MERTRELYGYYNDECDYCFDREEADRLAEIAELEEQEYADWCKEYEEWCNEVNAKDGYDTDAEAERLADYYEKHIKGHTPEELNIGNDICMMAYDLFRLLPDEKRACGYVFDESLKDIYLLAYANTHREYSLDYLGKCYDLAQAWESYSDWHKEVYYVRPHWFNG